MYTVLITGSRDFTNVAVIERQLNWYLDKYKSSLVVLHGACPTGADKIADNWALENHVTIIRVPADWNRHGAAAGPLRNKQMVLREPDVCLAFLNACSKNNCPQGPQKHASHGASGCAKLAERAGIPTYYYRNKDEE